MSFFNNNNNNVSVANATPFNASTATTLDNDASQPIRPELNPSFSHNLGVDSLLPSTNRDNVHNAGTSQSSLQTLQKNDHENTTMTSPRLSSPQNPSSSDQKCPEDQPDNIPGLYQLLYHGKDGEKIWQCGFVSRCPEAPFTRICGSHLCNIAFRVDHVNWHADQEMWLLHNNIISAEEVVATPHRIPVPEFTCADPDCGYLAKRGKSFKSAWYGAEKRHMKRYHSEVGRGQKVIGRRNIWARGAEGSAKPEGESQHEDAKDTAEEHTDIEMEELDEEDWEEYEEDWEEDEEEVKTEQEDNE